MIIEEIDDLFEALRLYSESLLVEARREFFLSLEHFGARPAISARTFERLGEELRDFVDEMEEVE